MLNVLTDLEGNAVLKLDYPLGVVVKHKLYHYRGVIVGYDMECVAGEKWYQSNKTQPSRNQPWYHVLVDESGGLSTYVAQSNLENDISGQPINHPRIDNYFSQFKDGSYVMHQGKLSNYSV
jgi:heat shock protein HspQ